MFKKWWVTLVQGILMFIIGIFILENPVNALAGASLWFGILIFVTGLAGICGWIFGGREEHEPAPLLWSIVCALFGLLILLNLLAAMKVITIIYGLWVLVTGFNLLHSGWSIKKDTVLGWVLILVGLFSIIAGVMMVFNINSGATGFATILGIQVILAGIALVILAFAKKIIVEKVKRKIQPFRETR